VIRRRRIGRVLSVCVAAVLLAAVVSALELPVTSGGGSRIRLRAGSQPGAAPPRLPEAVAAAGPVVAGAAPAPRTSVVRGPPPNPQPLPPPVTLPGPPPLSATCPGPGWQFVNSGAEAPPGSGWTWLNAVAVTSRSDAWAVGGRGGSMNRTLIDHWNGRTWSVASSPGPASAQELLAVAGSGADDVWAVGYQSAYGGPDQPLIEHWNGSSWTVVASPAVPPQTRMDGVAAISADDAWAVGEQEGGTASSGPPASPSSPGSGAGSGGAGSPPAGPLAEHWNGSAWTVVPIPDEGGSPNALAAVGAAGPDDVWAVGSSNNGSSGLAEHWNGSSWTAVPIDPGPLSGISVLSASDAWAVGGGHIEHWNGSSWSPSPTPPPPGGQYVLSGISAVSATDAWAVGESVGSAGNNTLAEHWNGLAWAVVPSPSPDHDDLLHSVALSGDGIGWAVGVAGWVPGATEPAPGALTEERCAG